jgi:hypothetical protein
LAQDDRPSRCRGPGGGGAAPAARRAGTRPGAGASRSCCGWPRTDQWGHRRPGGDHQRQEPLKLPTDSRFKGGAEPRAEGTSESSPCFSRRPRRPACGGILSATPSMWSPSPGLGPPPAVREAWPPVLGLTPAPDGVVLPVLPAVDEDLLGEAFDGHVFARLRRWVKARSLRAGDDDRTTLGPPDRMPPAC